MRVLLDNDVNLDFVLARQPFFTEAEQIFEAIARSEVEAFIASITAINIYYIGRKEKGRTATLRELEKLLQVVKVCPIDSVILQKALTPPITDYEDAVQHECAVAENLDSIIPRNIKNYKNSILKVYSPSEFLQTV